MEKKILYLSHIDWGWIKQRPHFLVEELSRYYDIEVVYEYSYKRKNLQKRNKNDISITPLFRIPKSSSCSFSKNLNHFFRRKQVEKKIKGSNYDKIIISYPNQIDLIPNCFSGDVIYDCMDNHLAFLDNDSADLVREQEIRLLNRAKVISVSSLKLKEVLLNRYGNNLNEKIILIRNGYNKNDEVNYTNESNINKSFRIGYVGTISNWFHIEFLERIVQEINNVKFELIGPIEGIDIKKNLNIDILGTIEHQNLYQEIKNMDCLIMPFKLNDIIESVDPVKLYEYINFNKNIISVEYKEIQRFDSFVHFYQDYESLKNIIINLMEDNTIKYSNEERIQFLQENTWEKRALEFYKAINFC